MDGNLLVLEGPRLMMTPRTLAQANSRRHDTTERGGLVIALASRHITCCVATRSHLTLHINTITRCLPAKSVLPARPRHPLQHPLLLAPWP